MKQWVKGFLFAIVGVLFLVGCSTDAPGSSNTTSSENQGTEDATLKVGFSISTLNNPFFVTLNEGAEAEAAKHGIEITTVDAQNDPSKQANDIEDLIQQGVQVLLINPADSEAITSSIKAANDAGIPVITVDRNAEGGEVVAHIASDNIAGGEMAGAFIIEQLGGAGKVVELEGIPGSSAARERGEGFNNSITNETGIEVVARQSADFDRAQGLTVMENILQSNREIDAIFAHNDEMALGAIVALESAGIEDVLVVGFDATDDAVKAVEDGKMAATVAQKPEAIGVQAIQIAIEVNEGNTVEEFIPVELELVQ
ncbi:ribose ABC transporter substrate-binding protein RbsB [Halalkalibacterium ligniniphilum]|uniref:ribose ABC transporter substrate-binding protein RbsB n=1 Tax=Halalkalibacterium ligniniphilum TaxID=1134413 RepID=UPI000348A4EC|nr:ribose ABC transporter substrate-binding protein RbsB [Halalkalibacterium ligniniphilum]